jgi:hypothetical protein
MGEGKVAKLVPNLRNKKNYVVHYRNLKLYLELGLQLKKVYRVLKCEQSAWLKPYIEYNTKQRAVAKSAFEKDFFKLMNNAVFGKTMENVRNRIDYELVTSPDRVTALTKRPRFKGSKIFNENLVGIEMLKSKVVLNKPIGIGFAILDLSKVLMYDFHYNTMKSKYEHKCKLLFTDTDSLTYEITTEDIYEDMKSIKDQFDFSDYPKEHPLYDTTNKKVIGKFKDETSGLPITEFVGLKAKMYSFLTEEMNVKKAKGVKSNVVKKTITHYDYRKCLYDDKHTTFAEMKTIQSKGHQLFSVTQNKIALTGYDDKRYYLNAFVSRAYGHYKNL